MSGARIGTRTIDRNIPLTKREREVLARVAEGDTNAEIAKRLFLSEQTIKTHVRIVLIKLRATARAHAVAEGFRRGLLS